MKENTSPLGDRIRKVAAQLEIEKQQQIKVTSRILAAAAQMAINEENLVTEVVEMVEDDLEKGQSQTRTPTTVESLKEQFKTLKEAKLHFELKAKSWDSLAKKLNDQLDTTSAQSFLQYPGKASDEKDNQFTDLKQVIDIALLARLNSVESKLIELASEVKELSALIRRNL